MSVRLHGAVAELRYAYVTAATLRDWSMWAEKGVTHLIATVVTEHPMWIAQRPLVCAVPGRPWRWPLLTLQIEGGALRATVAPREG